MKTWPPAPSLVTATAVLALAACTGSRAERAPAAEFLPSAELAVRRGDFVVRVLLTGELEAIRAESIVVPRLPSWQTTLRWMEADGARVATGQRVAELDGAALLSELEEQKLVREQAAGELERREAEIAAQLADKRFQVEQRRIALERAHIDAAVPAELLPRREWQEKQLALVRAGVEHDKALESLESFVRSSAQDLRQRRIAVEKAGRGIAIAESALDALTLKAPRDGILVVADHPWEGRKIQVGDSVWVGMTLFQIPDLGAMQVKAALADVDDRRIAPGMPAAVRLDAHPDLVLSGRVAEITPIAQEAEWRSLRRTFRATVALDRSDPDRMRPGMSVKVEVQAARREGVLLVPREALDLSRDPPQALLAGGGATEVRLGMCNADACVLEGGLDEGARLRRRG